jgi:hypothetical protein
MRMSRLREIRVLGPFSIPFVSASATLCCLRLKIEILSPACAECRTEMASQRDASRYFLHTQRIHSIFLRLLKFSSLVLRVI